MTVEPRADAEPGTLFVHGCSGLIAGAEFLNLVGVKLACRLGWAGRRVGPVEARNSRSPGEGPLTPVTSLGEAIASLRVH